MLNAELLEQLAILDPLAALTELEVAGLDTTESVALLADHALQNAEADSTAAKHWLAIASALNQRLDNSPSLRAQIDYAQARLYVIAGNLTLAETALRGAQIVWAATGDQASLARSNLGLTQVLAMQGRYVEAETTCRQALELFNQLLPTSPTFTEQLAYTYENLALLLSYQDRHESALLEYERAQSQIESMLATLDPADTRIASLQHAVGKILINRATSLSYLDRSVEAEGVLLHAISLFAANDDTLIRGKAHANLATLYVRTGRFALALSEFENATRYLLGEASTPESAELAQLELLLDQSNTYLALNLLPEAANSLHRCESLYRTADQPFELAQSLLSLGVLQIRLGLPDEAEQALREAERMFSGLQNELWRNRTVVALAAIEWQRNDVTRALLMIESVLSNTQRTTALGALRWDIATLLEARLLRLSIHLAKDEIESARLVAAKIASEIGVSFDDLSGTTPGLPHFALRLQHALAKIEQASGNQATAQRYLRAAVEQIELQRSSLPVEEVRSAFLDDKSAIYADLVLNLLEEPDPAAVNAAFDMVERARSRALLERLLSSINEPTSGGSTDESVAVTARRNELQQQLHWLYNRLSGESGSRRLGVNIDEEIRVRELALQQLGWQNVPQILDVQPIDLATLQQTLVDDQQVLVYFIAGDEVLAFVVERTQATVVRNLCSSSQLQIAQHEWSFQLGRAEMDTEYLLRHAERFEEAWRRALQRLHQLLITPLLPLLSAKRLLIVPYAMLHQLPFHALWDGEHFLIERFECSYAPSASVAVQSHKRHNPQRRLQSWAGLALSDPSIPAARAEVAASACHFATTYLYLDDQATLEGLQKAAQQADILHVATHGLFRPDNAFFSVLKLADGWIDVRELYRLKLSAHLVVLSACESGAGQIHGGDEVVGLARGFLGAGADTLVASLWNVHDASSAQLMDGFYSYLTATKATHTVNSALRATQLDAVGRGIHPYYWAPYIVIGS